MVPTDSLTFEATTLKSDSLRRSTSCATASVDPRPGPGATTSQMLNGSQPKTPETQKRAGAAGGPATACIG